MHPGSDPLDSLCGNKTHSSGSLTTPTHNLEVKSIFFARHGWEAQTRWPECVSVSVTGAKSLNARWYGERRKAPGNVRETLQMGSHLHLILRSGLFQSDGQGIQDNAGKPLVLGNGNMFFSNKVYFLPYWGTLWAWIRFWFDERLFRCRRRTKTYALWHGNIKCKLVANCFDLVQMQIKIRNVRSSVLSRRLIPSLGEHDVAMAIKSIVPN